MPNLRTKIISFLLIVLSSELSYGQLTLEDIFLNRKYVPKITNGISFFNNEAKYAVLEQNQIIIYNTNAQKLDAISLSEFWKNEYASLPNFQSVTVSNTNNYFLLKANEERIYRNAIAANYFIMNQQKNITKIGGYKISFPTFSDDDKMIAYVKENNIFIYNIESDIEQQITFDGKWNFIINGKSDWVYEEEFKLTNAFVWCANNTKIAYLKFNETNVKEYTFPYYFGQTYPSNFSYKYPKAGEQNSIVSANYYDVKKKKNYKIDLSNYSYEYIPRIIAADNEVYFMLLNRHQDSLKIVSYNFTTKQTKLVFTDVSKQYVLVPNGFFALKDKSFIVTSERNGFNQLYHFDENGKLLKQLTDGTFEVTNFYGVDEINKKVYYQSNETSVYNKNVFSVNYETREKELLTTENGINEAIFSRDFSNYIYTFSSATTPPEITLCSTKDITKITLEKNQFLIDSLLPKLNTKSFITTQLHHDKTIIHSFEIVSNQTTTDKKYPQLFYVYGGPNHQEVWNEWCYSPIHLWLYYMAQQGFKITCIDGRGSSGKGAEYRRSTYLNLGKQETEDLIEYAKYILQFPDVDTSRIGIFGWSYGGFLSLLCLEQKQTPFKTAVAVAPVTNWKFYNNVYTEQFMRTPQENPSGYEQFNPISLAKDLSGNLLLIHATADDNVHFQNSVELINALNDANKPYQFYMYPDKEHSILGRKNRYDLFLKITQFLIDKL
jgi:dipeptidyl-peptidase-4